MNGIITLYSWLKIVYGLYVWTVSVNEQTFRWRFRAESLSDWIELSDDCIMVGFARYMSCQCLLSICYTMYMFIKFMTPSTSLFVTAFPKTRVKWWWKILKKELKTVHLVNCSNQLLISVLSWTFVSKILVFLISDIIFL